MSARLRAGVVSLALTALLAPLVPGVASAVPPTPRADVVVAPVVRAASTMPSPDQLSGVGDARQVIVVSNPTSVSYARLTAWQRTSSGWVSVRGLRNLPARIGRNGFTPGTTRRQGTQTTPTGSYDLGFAFGTGPQPAGTRVPYRVVRQADRWVYDRSDPSTYNTYQPSGDWGNQERLAYIPNGQYRYAVVIGFNHPRMSTSPTAHPHASPLVNVKAGGGIFLHVKKYVDGVSLPTAGCVSVDRPQMAALLAWLNPAQHPRIIMGPRSAIVRASTSAITPAASKLTLGYSHDGAAITATRLGSTNPSRTLVVIGSIHGDETDGHAVVSALRAATIPRGLAVWVIRTMNPDGVAGDHRRNNARPHGVDLNRNFPTSWAASDPTSSRYSGPRAASEPETQAVMSFLRRVKPGLVVIFHSPLYGVDGYGITNSYRRATARALASDSGFPLRSFDCTGGCHGTLTQWFNAGFRGQAITFEFGPSAPSARTVRRVAWALLHVAATRA